jgi:hypothetical protein
MALHKLTARTWLTADRSRAVPDGDPDAAYLLGAEGAEIDTAEAQRLGLTASKAQADAPAIKAVDHAPENKAVAGPAQSKGKR